MTTDQNPATGTTLPTDYSLWIFHTGVNDNPQL